MKRIGDYNVNVIFRDLPVPEMTCKNADDSYTIFINARLSSEEQNKMFVHAVKHITQNDFEKLEVQRIEVV